MGILGRKKKNSKKAEKDILPYKDGLQTVEIYNQTLDLATLGKVQDVSYQVEIDILYTDARNV